MSNEFIPQNLYGNAKGLYQDILEEIEARDKDHYFSIHSLQELKKRVMPRIAKALQNKLVISMDWEAAQKDDSRITSEEEFIEMLEFWQHEDISPALTLAIRRHIQSTVSYLQKGELSMDIIVSLKQEDFERNDFPAPTEDDYDCIYQYIEGKIYGTHGLLDEAIKECLCERKAKAKYAKFLQFFPEDEHEAVLTAIAYKGTYENDDTQQNFFLNKMQFFRILTVGGDNMSWNMSPDEEFFVNGLGVFASVVAGIPRINEEDAESHINGYEFSEDTIDDQLTGYLDWASERCGQDLARYKKWAIENKKDPLGLLNNVLPLQ